MARTYKKDLDDLPVVLSLRGLDWALLQRIEDLLRPYVRPDRRNDLTFAASDSRGIYDAKTVDDLRAEVDGQEERPDYITIELRGQVRGSAPQLVEGRQ